jgi:tetratricopeptide (TPR) repeat protein
METVTTVENAAGEAAVPEQGTVGRFAVVGVLGRGGMGVVLRARDPELGREVAVKLISPESTDRDATARIVREAQAMARLSHPNVVTVYEVGRAGEQPFIAMELIEGETLRAWLRERPRGWREVLAMFLPLGHGLAAVHAVGIVHRDVKPENVLVGRDGRPRVSDFGLVSGTGGTPAYMAPEQRDGAVDARADQYAYCVSLWEALHGGRPPTRDGRGVPGWLEAAVRRGLAADPAARWPSVSALLEAIERRRDRGRRIARVALTAGVAIGVGVAVAAITDRGAAAEACPTPTGRIASVWSRARGDALRAHLEDLDPQRGEARAAYASEVFGRDADSWAAMHVESCRATRAGRQSDTLLDLRTTCLDHRLAELAGTIERLEQTASGAELDAAMPAVEELSPLSACADTEAMTSRLPPPADPAARAEAEAIATDLLAIDLDQRTGRGGDLRERAKAVVARARALHHPPALSEALLTLAVAEVSALDADAARATLEEVVQVASEAHDDAAAAQAWMRLIRLHGDELEHPETAAALIPVTNAAVVRAGNSPELRVSMLVYFASFLQDHGQPEQALTYLDDAEALLDEIDDASMVSAMRSGIVYTRATTLLFAGRSEEAITQLEAAARDWEKRLGPDHPYLGMAYLALASAYTNLGRSAEMIAAEERAVAFYDARAADGPELAMALMQLGNDLTRTPRNDEAIAALERAVAIGRALFPADGAQRMAALSKLSSAYQAGGRNDEAVAMSEEAVKVAEQSGARGFDYAVLLYDRGELLFALNRPDEAIESYRKSIAVMDEVRGKGDAATIYPLRGIGQTLLEKGDVDGGIEALERALAVPTTGAGHEQLSAARFYLGSTLVETRRDRKRGIALLRQARGEFEAMGLQDVVAEIDRILD